MPDRIFEDDPSIANDEKLFRRILPNWLTPGEQGSLRVSSAAFKHLEMSVLIESLVAASGRQPEDALREYPDQCLVAITAGLARGRGMKVVVDNQPPNDPAHGLVVGKKTQSIANAFARSCTWVIPPEAPPIVD